MTRFSARLRRAPALGEWVRRRSHRSEDDAGTMILVAIILVALLAVLGPVMVTSVTGDAPLVVQSTNRHAALAAAEAGIQWYRNLLDTDPNYFQYSATNNPLNDPALAVNGWCSSACDLGGTSPPEAFHYTPDDSHLFAQSGGGAGQLLLTVTGRAGSPGSYSYVTAQARFETSSVLDNAYFSNYELLDPNSPTEQGEDITVTPAGSTQATSVPITSFQLPGKGETMWSALCLYRTFAPNTFIDSLGTSGPPPPGGLGFSSYSSSDPYYGPYYGGGFAFTDAAGDTVQIPAASGDVGPCGPPYDFVSGETFSGPVYSSDQVHVCQSPAFDGGSSTQPSYTSGAPSSTVYPYDVPGSTAVTTANSGANGPYPSSSVGYWAPQGWTEDTVNCGNNMSPQFAHGHALNGQESLPSYNDQLEEYANGTLGSGTGCVYTGPTMIELVSSTTPPTMNVWSPLSSSTATIPACRTPSGGSAQTFSTSHPFITGIPLPANGVIYVANYTASGSSSATCASYPGLGGDLNPYEDSIHPGLGASSPSCTEGDTYVEGELKGQLTIASQANIIITRDITYACADGSGGANQTDPSSVSACTTETEPDVLGLSAYADILLSNPGGGTDASCGYDGTASTLGQTGSTTGTQSSAQPQDVWPTCDLYNPIIDAALVALQGSFGAQNWGVGYQQGNAYLNGSDVSDYRGPFGIVGSTGYYKEFSYDTRLQYLQPPYILPELANVWQETSYISCGNEDAATQTSPVCPTVG